jgi:putative GTP pyrophosphokinase
MSKKKTTASPTLQLEATASAEDTPAAPGDPTPEASLEDLIALYRSQKTELELFLEMIERAIAKTAPPDFRGAVHSTRARMKGEEKIAGKLARKKKDGKVVSCENFFQEFSDLAGLRILTIYRWGFEPVHNFISRENAWWEVIEEPEAYAVYPEDVQRFEKIGLKPKVRKREETNPDAAFTPYTSIHYTVVRPGRDFPRCEIQVRGLHLEGWGEVDHQLRYPDRDPGKLACDLLSLLHQAAAVTDWLAHLSQKAAEIEEKQRQEKTNLQNTLKKLEKELAAALRDNAEAETTIEDLRKMINRGTQFPGIGVTGGAQGLLGVTGSYYGDALGPIRFGSCELCSPNGGAFVSLKRCSRCGRSFCQTCAGPIRLAASNVLTISTGAQGGSGGFETVCRRCAESTI